MAVFKSTTAPVGQPLCNLKALHHFAMGVEFLPFANPVAQVVAYDVSIFNVHFSGQSPGISCWEHGLYILVLVVKRINSAKQ